jgi:hypothetical protein
VSVTIADIGIDVMPFRAVLRQGVINSHKFHLYSKKFRRIVMKIFLLNKKKPRLCKSKVVMSLSSKVKMSPSTTDRGREHGNGADYDFERSQSISGSKTNRK